MPSEKSRYLNRYQGPASPVEFNELRERLRALDKDCLVEMIWQRFGSDRVLRKAAVVAIALRSAKDFEEAKSAIDYAFYFSDTVRYTDKGYGQILWEVKSALEFFVEQGRMDFALSVGKYAVDEAELALESFEDDWDWQGPLIELREWVNKLAAR